MKPQCYVIAGPNGSGKTTFAREFLPRYVHCLSFVNPDLIAQGLSPFDPVRAMTRAGRLVLQEIRYKRDQHEDFAIETTLAGRTYLREIQEMKVAGYTVHLLYLWILSPELAICRIRDRVESGGHNVPEQDVCEDVLGVPCPTFLTYTDPCLIRCTSSITQRQSQGWFFAMTMGKWWSMILFSMTL